jgi:hypothetical protein
MLASEFIEGMPAKSIGAGGGPSRSSSGAIQAVDFGFDDSDDDTDDHLVLATTTHAAADKDEDNEPYKQINVPSSAYTTYLSLLSWIHTQNTSFAPLHSTFRTSPSVSDAEVRIAWMNAMTEMVSRDPQLPVPSSPKSLYRLAHFLDMPALSKQALANLQYQLTEVNIAYELFDDITGCYDEVREMKVLFAIEHWDKVSGDPSFDEIERKLESGELSGAAAVTGFRLARKMLAKIAAEK